MKQKVLMLASVASMIDQFNMPNIRLLQEMGYEVHVTCNFKDGNTCSEAQIQKLKRKLAKMGVIRHSWECPRDLCPLKKCRKAYVQLCRLMERETFAWMHCQSPIGGALARLAAHRAGVPVIYTAHGFHFYKGAPLQNWFLYYPAEKFLARWTDVLITINKEDYRLAKHRLKAGKVCYTPGVGIDIEKYAGRTAVQKSEYAEGMQENCAADAQAFRRKYKIPQDAMILLSVGELNKGKNHQAAAAALAAMKRRDVYYMICGQGALREQLKKYAEKRKVSSRLRMPGYQENMPWIYQNADIFVFPSMREGMPAALMEAMAAGLPCAVSDIRGNRELIDKALRFSLKKPRQLQKLLERLLEDEALRVECGRRNQEKIRGYGRAAADRRIRRIYKELSMRTAGGAACRKYR